MWFWRLKQCFLLTLALIVCFLLGAGVKTANTFRLSELTGTHTFYLQSKSSQALIKHELTLGDIFRIRGESVELVLESEDVKNPYAFACQIAQHYGAELVAQECAGGSVSYYFYSPRWENGAMVAGQAVNLHIAVRGDRCVVGSPIIFGGF